ncbi:penicillin-binding protein [Patescibacteria group bacterium]|nr:MAG: penicillin-binding protein [Patescibacteria group bacterium]
MIRKSKKSGSRSSRNTGRNKRDTYTTSSGQTIKINRSLGQKLKARKATHAQARAERLAGMPKGRLQRMVWRMHPKRLWKYWPSREGMIMGLKLTGIAILAGFLLLVGVFAYFRKDLPNLKDISGNNIGGSIRYYDKTGKTLLFEDYDAVRRIPVQDERIAQVMKDATVAIEDKDFFKHGGFDTRGILRAAVNNVKGGGGQQGGSTITQQLVKLTQNWSQERTYTRKVKELILAVELERSYSKKEILTGYLNAAPYGSIYYGAQAAAEGYFNKDAKDLTLDEAALLAAIPKSPGYYSPYNDDFVTSGGRESLLGRQDYILDQMKEQGLITQDQLDEAKKVDTLKKIKKRKPRYDGIKAPYFVLTAKSALEKQMGAGVVKHGGLDVITTLDMDAQKVAEEQVNAGLAQVRAQGGDTAAFVAEDVKTGQVVALVGGADFNNAEYGENNYAHALELPPGSSFKPYDYAALIEKSDNVGAGSVLYDTKGVVPGYPCTTGVSRTGNCLVDYDLRYPGPLTLRYSLGGSRNVPAIKAMLTVGVDETIDVAQRLMTNFGSDGQPDPTKGAYNCYSDEAFSQKTQCYAASAIGDGAYLRLDEHAHGYATLARNGRNIPQTYIMKVTDATGKVLNEWKPSEGVQAIREESAYIVTDMMSDPNASYLPNKIHRFNGWKFGAKTGTTNDSKDGLMGMLSARYATMVWVGYHNRTVEMSGFMESMTLPIVNGWMQSMHQNIPAEEIPKPAGLQTLPAFVVRSHVGAGSIEPSPSSDLFPSWYKKPSVNTNQKIDKVSNKLATECTPERAVQTGANANSSAISVDKSVGGGGGANTNEKDDVHKCNDTKPKVSISTRNVTCLSSGCTLTVKVTAGTHPISSDKFPGQLNFIIDGQNVSSKTLTGPGTYSISYKPTFSGTKQLRVEVIDSVLYDGSDTTNVTGQGGGFSVTARNGGRFEWSGASGAVTIYRTGDDSEVGGCVDRHGSSCNSSLSSGVQVYAKDEDDNRVDLVSK